jgi:hypothetical protein
MEIVVDELIYENSAFKDYLTGKCPAEQYHSVCKIVTEGFQDVSQEIQDVEKKVNELDKVIGGMIRQLQNIEKERLEKVIDNFMRKYA